MPTEDDERSAKIENLQADTEYKRVTMKWEPWKAMAVAAGTGATITLALLALATFVLGRLVH